MNKICKINLKMFNSEKDFFTNAFEEAYNISNNDSEDVEAPVGDIPPPVDEIDDKGSDESVQGSDGERELTPDEVKELYAKHFGQEDEEEDEDEVEYDEETQSAIELFKYLESNPHLVQAMREYDAQGHQQLSQYVPDETTKRINELENFKAEYEYNKYVDGLKSKYSDFDEDKVLEYAEKVDVTDLEVAYKAMKSDSVKEPNVEELREQIRKEILEELKNNSIQTQSLVGGINQKPINTNEDVNLSSREQRIAKAMGISPSEYAKWR